METNVNELLSPLTLAIIGVLAYQLYVSARMVRSKDYEPRQKVAQLALVWVLPVVGAAVVHWFLNHGASDSGRDRTDRNHIPQGKNHYGR
jgi:hypothetical protein